MAKILIDIPDKERAVLDAWIAQLDSAERGLPVEDLLATRLQNEYKSMLAQADFIQTRDVTSAYAVASPEQKEQIKVILGTAVIAEVGIMGRIANFFSAGSNNA